MPYNFSITGYVCVSANVASVLLYSFLIKTLCQKMNRIVSPANANAEDYENGEGEVGKLNYIGL